MESSDRANFHADVDILVSKCKDELDITWVARIRGPWQISVCAAAPANQLRISILIGPSARP
jgi:hypothetical protein